MIEKKMSSKKQVEKEKKKGSRSSNRVKKGKRGRVLSKLMKSGIFWKVLIPVIIVILLFGAYTTYRFTFLKGAEGFFLTTEKKGAGNIVLTAVNEVARINMLKVIHRKVFPYDYIDTDFDALAVRQKIRREELVTPEERFQLSVDKICKKNRIYYERGGEFVVITAIIKLGYNLPANPQDIINFDELNDRWVVEPGEPEVLDIVFEDFDPDNYHYPDIGLSPGAYRDVIVLIESQLDTKKLLEDHRDEIRKQFFCKLEILLQ